MARAKLSLPCHTNSRKLTHTDIAALAGEALMVGEDPQEYDDWARVHFGTPPTYGTKGMGFDMRPHGAHAAAL